MTVIGIGFDLVDIPRFRTRAFKVGDAFLLGLFTSKEIDAAGAGPNRYTRLAGRFAAKEAVLKALGTGWVGDVSWHDIEVIPTPAGRPEISLTGRSAEVAEELCVRTWHVTISHTKTCAAAMALAVG